MRALLSIISILAILFSGLNSYAFGKKKNAQAPTPIVNSVPDDDENIKPINEKKTKLKKEKTIKETKVKETKVKEKKTKAEKKSEKLKTQFDSENITTTKEQVEKPVKVSKKKKNKNLEEEFPMMTDKQKREIEYVQNYYNSTIKNRSALAMYLNPNLDVREVRASHILVKNRKDALQIRKDILDGTITFEEAAQRYSLCPSGMNGGDLGFFHRKKMEQQFADTAFDLKIGEISKPVGTKFGWHIIKTTDKR